jgi:hypothetical protein
VLRVYVFAAYMQAGHDRDLVYKFSIWLALFILSGISRKRVSDSVIV